MMVYRVFGNTWIEDLTDLQTACLKDLANRACACIPSKLMNASS